MRILSGIQPSGRFHIGNYFAMMRRMIEYQRDHDLYCFIASYHAITTVDKRSELAEGIFEAALDFFALGMDPEKSTFWVQSDVPEVTELAWLLSTSITVPQLELAHSYKDKISQGISPTAGLFLYPVLMAADILAFGSERVPVGKDQKQHLELSRDICRRFNNHYGETFIMPEADILEDVATIPGVDGRKMSKSYNNTIPLFADEKELKKIIMSVVTDSAGLDDPKDTENSVLFDLYSLFLDENGIKELKDRFRTPGTGYGHIKQDLFKTVLEYFGPFREKRADLASRPDDVRDMLQAGANKARAVASDYLDMARRATGFIY